MVGEVMIDYLWLVMSVLFFISAVANGIRWFIIRKDYKVSSFLVVIIHLIAFIFFLLKALKIGWW